jgi:hypothetical protein
MTIRLRLNDYTETTKAKSLYGKPYRDLQYIITDYFISQGRYYIIPPMPPPPIGGPAGASSGSSANTTSVVNNIAAIEAAFSKATRPTLVGSILQYLHFRRSDAEALQ